MTREDSSLQEKEKEMVDGLLRKDMHDIQDDKCMSLVGDHAPTYWSRNMRAVKKTTTSTTMLWKCLHEVSNRLSLLLTGLSGS